MELTDEERQIFCEVVDTFEVPEGAYNFRVNGKSVGRKSTKNINVVPKEGGRGLDIYIKKGTKNETVHIPVAIIFTQRLLVALQRVEGDEYLGALRPRHARTGQLRGFGRFHLICHFYVLLADGCGRVASPAA